MTLLDEARAAGLIVTTRGGDLIIRGPGRTEPLAQRLLQRKAEVMALLAAEDAAIAWRRDAMAGQLIEHRPVPVLVARRTPDLPDHCLSCGDPLSDGVRFRCDACIIAAWAVLASRPPPS